MKNFSEIRFHKVNDDQLGPVLSDIMKDAELVREYGGG